MFLPGLYTWGFPCLLGLLWSGGILPTYGDKVKTDFREKAGWVLRGYWQTTGGRPLGVLIANVASGKIEGFQWSCGQLYGKKEKRSRGLAAEVFDGWVWSLSKFVDASMASDGSEYFSLMYGPRYGDGEMRAGWSRLDDQGHGVFLPEILSTSITCLEVRARMMRRGDG